MWFSKQEWHYLLETQLRPEIRSQLAKFQGHYEIVHIKLNFHFIANPDDAQLLTLMPASIPENTPVKILSLHLSQDR